MFEYFDGDYEYDAHPSAPPTLSAATFYAVRERERLAEAEFDERIRERMRMRMAQAFEDAAAGASASARERIAAAFWAAVVRLVRGGGVGR